MAATNIADAVREAVAEIDAGGGKAPKTEEEVAARTEEKEETKEETAEAETTSTETPAEETLEVEASADEINNALVLFRTLQDPAKRADFVKTLATSSGIKLETKEEVKQAAKDIKTILKEKLGDAYDLIAGDALSEALNDILGAELERNVKPLRDKITQQEQAQNQRTASEAMDRFFSKHKIEHAKRDELAGKMLQKMQMMPATPNTKIDEYLDDIYTIVGGAKSDKTAPEVKKVITKIVKNAKEATKASGEGAGDVRIKVGSRLPSLSEAVKAAVEGKKFDYE